MRAHAKPIPPIYPRAAARFAASSPSRPAVGCWEWSGEKNEDGYGKFFFAGSRFFAHRVSYAIANGGTPADKIVMHTCDNPGCIRPDHLVAGDDLANSKDMATKGRHWLQKAPHGQRGERNPVATLTEQVVLAARQMYAQGGVEMQQLAAQFGVGEGALRLAIRGRTWAHVGGPIAQGDQRNKTPHTGTNRRRTNTGALLPHQAVA